MSAQVLGIGGLKIVKTTSFFTLLLLFLLFPSIFAQTPADEALQNQLESAIVEGDLNAVQQALKAGAKPAGGAEKGSAWYWAMTSNNYREEIAKLFDPRPSDLEYAAARIPSLALSNRAAEIERRAKAGVSLNARDKASGETGLMVAAFDGFSHSIRILLANGADPQLTNSKGQTALDIVKSAIKEKRWNQSDLGVPEEDFRTALKLLASSQSGTAVGKVFEADGNEIQISGAQIKRLKKGSRIEVKSANGTIDGVVKEVLHTKARAQLKKAGARKGDRVFLKNQ